MRTIPMIVPPQPVSTQTIKGHFLTSVWTPPIIRPPPIPLSLDEHVFNEASISFVNGLKPSTGGLTVGASVGFSVGFCVGGWVGFCVGASVGFCVDASVGFCVGAVVGFCVGACVGFSVGGSVGGSGVPSGMYCLMKSLWASILA